MLRNKRERGSFLRRRNKDTDNQPQRNQNTAPTDAGGGQRPRPQTEPKTVAPNSRGRVTRSLRMTEKARKRLGRIHTNTGKRKSAIFREMLSEGLAFSPEELGGHKCEAKFTVELSEAEYAQLEQAKDEYQTGLVNVVSALILRYHP